jgi:hypothetical protein
MSLLKEFVSLILDFDGNFIFFFLRGGFVFLLKEFVSEVLIVKVWFLMGILAF